MQKEQSKILEVFDSNTEKIINILQNEFKNILLKASTTDLSELNDHIAQVYISKIDSPYYLAILHDLIVDVDAKSGSKDNFETSVSIS